MNLSATDLTAVETIVADGMDAGDIPGFAMSIDGPTGSLLKTWGFDKQNPGYKPPVFNVDNHCRLGSVTKIFTATVIFRLIDQGLLGLDDTLDTFDRPGWTLSDIPNASSITVRHLLSMRTGIYEYTTDPTVRAAFVTAHNHLFSVAGALDTIKGGTPAPWAPGTQYSYADSNTVLLGLIAETVDGRCIENMIAQDVIGPLGLTQTRFDRAKQHNYPVPPNKNQFTPPDPSPQAYMTNPIFAPSSQVATSWNPNFFGAAGAITSTIGDLAILGQYLKSEPLISAESHALRTTEFHGINYGMEGPVQFGYGLAAISFGRLVGHSGSVPGYESCCFYDTETGAVFATLANRQTTNFISFSRILKRVAEALYPGSMNQPTTYL